MNADDRQAILDLIAQYGYMYDSNDVEGYIALFHDDAVMHVYVPGQTTPVFTHRSHSERRAFMLERRGTLAQQGIQPRHYQTNPVLTEVGEGLVRGQTMLLLTHLRPGEATPRVMSTGICQYEFRRSADGWKFSRRDSYGDVAPPQVGG